MHFASVAVNFLAFLAPAWAYEVATDKCCQSQLEACHKQGANACMWTNAAICVDNPKNRVPVDDTCLKACPDATVKNPNGFLYKFQKHGAPAGDCVCGNLNPNLSKYCYGG
ncbi:uncharacterized protein BDZ83DRAFT_118863 [Colletotrichum acutatum]|uniref:Uncharacterized protein n=1 Tax=Glomerella acutata TaxID=27357 RepID=A0AAD8UCK9_GLOAC|nr:uncharacterized protein BDZ83DRAFT_118863 [Colletotrichum acutatum]KAK1711270.1 hypothetical protein BDZ83DRAFT_118863 [Colletotrichum acutatum]